MLTIVKLVIDVITALPSLITGVEAAFGSKPKSGPSKWIAVESALSGPISSLASEVSKTVPNKKADEIATAVAVFTKGVNDAIVAFYNSVGWPAATKPSGAA